MHDYHYLVGSPLHVRRVVLILLLIISSFREGLVDTTVTCWPRLAQAVSQALTCMSAVHFTADDCPQETIITMDGHSATYGEKSLNNSTPSEFYLANHVCTITPRLMISEE